MIRRAQQVISSTGGSITQNETFEIFNGTNPQGFAQALFETLSGNDVSLADIVEDSRTLNLNHYSKKDLNSTGVATGIGIGYLRGVNIINPNTYDVWLKFYNKSTAPNVGTDATNYKIQVPANGSLIIDTTSQSKVYFAAGVGIAVTKNYLDSDATAVATNCEVYIATKLQ